MKTLSETERERVESVRSSRESHCARLGILLGKSSNTPPLHPDLRAALRASVQRAVQDDHEYLPEALGVACDHCGTELIRRDGGLLMSNPPKISIGCVGCGWIGSMVR